MKPSLSDLEALARGAGEILRAGYDHQNHVDRKGEIDLVTEVDRQSEAYLLAAGTLIARQAGAVVTKMDGRSKMLIPPYSVLAANPKLLRGFRP